jgi:hypothetical protein
MMSRIKKPHELEGVMAHHCPRCRKEIEVRRWRATGMAGGPGAGLVYVLGWVLAPRYFCPEHGEVPRPELPPAARRRMLAGSVLRLAVLLACLLAIE